MADVLHLSGPVLVGPDDVRGEIWVVDGRITFTKPTAAAQTVAGWVLPGPGRRALPRRSRPATVPVDEAQPRTRLRADRDAGTLLIRDAGSPVGHALGRRPRRPPATDPGREAHRPEPPLPAGLRPRGRTRGRRRVRPAGGPARRRLGQAGRRLDRPRDGRPVPVLPARDGRRRGRGRARGGRAARRPTASARSRSTTSRRREPTASSTPAASSRSRSSSSRRRESPSSPRSSTSRGCRRWPRRAATSSPRTTRT